MRRLRLLDQRGFQSLAIRTDPAESRSHLLHDLSPLDFDGDFAGAQLGGDLLV